MSSSENDYSWLPVFTPAEAAKVTTERFEEFRNDLRAAAQKSGGEYGCPYCTEVLKDPIRQAYLRAVERFNVLEEAVRAAFGAPSRTPPPDHELAPDPEGPDASQKLPWAGPVPSTNRVAKNSSARHSRLGGDPWAA